MGGDRTPAPFFMKAGVAIDSWKLDIFRKHLDKAGFKYTVGPGITPDTLLLSVECDWAHKLKPVLERAQAECARRKRH